MPLSEDVKPESPETAEGGEPESAPEEQPGSAEPETDAAETESKSEGAGPEPRLEPLDVYALLRLMVAQLSAAAWQKMGLQPDPFTDAIHRDVAQARVAIDCVAVLAEKLLPQLHGQEVRDLQSLLTDLRLNFVRQSQEKPPEA